jgi:hypothetical protein
LPIFISHSARDEAVYSVLCIALDANGIERWDPSAVRSGQILAHELRDAISACEACIFLATRRSVESPWCLAELGAFWGARKPVFLFVADSSIADADLPPEFKGNVLVHTAYNLIDQIKRMPKDGPAEFPQCLYYYGSDKVLRTDAVFQDFKVVPQTQAGNINALQHIWADAFKKSTLTAETENNTLRLTFNNARGGYPCNVAVRGQGDIPTINRPFKPYLAFAARLPGSGPPVSVAVRVVNGFMQHWVYGTGVSAYRCEEIKSPQWDLVSIKLAETTWQRFESDGNPDGPSLPDFHCICSVVLEIGSCEGSRPGPGSGSIEVGPIVLLAKDELQERRTEYSQHFSLLADER